MIRLPVLSEHFFYSPFFSCNRSRGDELRKLCKDLGSKGGYYGKLCHDSRVTMEMIGACDTIELIGCFMTPTEICWFANGDRMSQARDIIWERQRRGDHKR